MKDKKLIGAIFAFVIILLLTLASTYAYFTARVSRTNNTPINTTQLTTTELGVEYIETNGINIDPTDVLTGDWAGMVLLSVENTGSVTQMFDISWDTVTTNTIVGFADISATDATPEVSEVECIDNLTTGNNPTACTTVDVRDDFYIMTIEHNYDLTQNNTPTIENIMDNFTRMHFGIDSGEWSCLYSVDDDVDISRNIVIAPGEIKQIAVFIEYQESTERNQNYQQGVSFNGTIKVDNVRMLEEVVGLASDWSYDTSENNVELTAFIGDLSDCQNVIATPNYWTDLNLTEPYKSAANITLASQLANNVAYDITIPNVIVDGDNRYYVEVLSETLFQGSNFSGTIVNDNYARIKSITIPEGILNTSGSLMNNNGTFLGNLSNSTFNIPSSMMSIGDLSYAYNNISGSISLTDNLFYIGTAAFQYNNITSVQFGNSIKSIGMGAFEYNNITGIVNIPYSVASIGIYAFAENLGITSINFVGRNTLGGLSLSQGWNVLDKSEETYATVTCNGNPCV